MTMNGDMSWLSSGGDSGRAAAAAAAAAAANQLNQKLSAAGVAPPNMGGMPIQQGGMPGGMPPMGLGAVMDDEHQVPDRMVGLIIGKGGEQIATIQAESGCKVQFAPDSMGMPHRNCTLTGTQESIAKAKSMIQEIVSRGNGSPDGILNGSGPGAGGSMVEVMVPGNKVGLVIGKGGETIRQLQEQAGVKMVMIQESNSPTASDKPLRITGEHAKCIRGKELVLELLAEKEGAMMNGGGGGPGFNNMMNGFNNGGGSNKLEIQVPRPAVGVVIGRQGETINKIQTETGTRVQFLPDDGQTENRLCSIEGPHEQCQAAAKAISECIDGLAERQANGGGGGGGGFRQNGGSRGGEDCTLFPVPAEKCGLVIGKQGDTIRKINTTTGAHVELQRTPGPNPEEKVFQISGNPQQVQHAMSMIAEKAGCAIPAGAGFGGGYGGPSGPGGQFGVPEQNGFGGYGAQQQQNGYGSVPQQNGWGGAPSAQPGQFGGNWENPGQSPDKQQQAAGGGDANAAAWAAYYAQLAAAGQPQPQQPQLGAPVAQAQPAAAAQPQPSFNPQTGQVDYSQAWAAYYRSQGMNDHAEAILAQQQGAQPAAGGMVPAGGAMPQQQPGQFINGADQIRNL